MYCDIPGCRQYGAGILRALQPAHVRVLVLRGGAEAGGEAAELPAGGHHRVAARPQAHASLQARRDVPSVTSSAQQSLHCCYGEILKMKILIKNDYKFNNCIHITF